VLKKKLTFYQHFSTAYRQTYCEACVNVSRLYNENYIFYEIKLTKLWKNGRNFLRFNSAHSNVCKSQKVWSIFKGVTSKNILW